MKIKKLLAAALAGIMGFANVIPVDCLNTAATSQASATELSDPISDMTIESTNSFGSLLASELIEKQAEQLANNGCNIFSVEMDGNEATVSYQTVVDCTLVIGIYDEDGTTLYATGTAEVTPDERETTVTIETDEMPQYFYVKGYLADSYILSPLCTLYECPNYTQEMQDFFAKTVDDFDEQKVINFDDDKTNNFAVYGENTIVIPENEGYNIVTSADDENAVYVIENADDNVLALQKDDIFSYMYGDNELLIVKIGAIDIDGTTVTITGADSEMNEVFDYVRIDAEQGLADADITTYNGTEVVDVEEEPAPISKSLYPMAKGRSVENDTTVEKVLELEYKDEVFTGSTDSKNNTEPSFDGNFSITGSISLKASAGAKLYLSTEYCYVELEIKFSSEVHLTFTAEAKFSVPLASVGFDPVPGVIVEITPTIIFKLSGEIDLNGTWEGSLGLRATTQDGGKIENISKKPEFTFSVKAEGSYYLGVDLNPKVSIISEKIINVGVTGEIGFEMIGTMEKSVGTNTEMDIEKIKEMHECVACISEKFNFKFTLSFEVDPPFIDKLTITLLDKTIELAQFYNSIDYGESGIGECPHRLYQVKVTVTDSSRDPMENVEVSLQSDDAEIKTMYIPYFPEDVDTMTTDENGTFLLYCSTGNVHMITEEEGYDRTNHNYILSLNKNKELKINNEKTNEITMRLSKEKHDVTVTVTDESGNPIPFATFSCGRSVASKNTDMSGKATLRLTDGTYHFKVALRGYITYEFSETIDGEDKDFSVVLTGGDTEEVTTTDETSSDETETDETATDETATTEVTSSTEATANIIDSGTCGDNGDNLTWTLDDEGTLRISGTGDMYEYSSPRQGADSPWRANKDIKAVIINEGVTSIGSRAFRECDALTSITISDSVTSIGIETFLDCKSLTSITIPDNVTSIGDHAFEGCSGLTSINISDNVKGIKAGVFYGCDSLTSITIPNSVEYIGYDAFRGCSSLTSITILDGVTAIGDYAFEGCNELISITIPDSVTIINKYAFYNCSSLTSITIPDGVTSISESTFEECSGLTSITIPDSVTSISNDAFFNCSSLISITIPDGVTSINKNTFWGCCNLTSITIPDSVTSIGSAAFYSCSGLTSITIPDSVTSIDMAAFDDCSSLTSITIPDSVTSINKNAFNGCSSLTSITIPDSVTSIEEGVFKDCSSLTSIIIPYKVESIGTSAFEGCSGLTSIAIPDGVTIIGESAFEGCSGLTLITIPDSVTSIRHWAFGDCDRLKSITIPDSVTSIGAAFNSCDNLESITIENPDCEIVYYYYGYAIPKTATIYGYTGSTAEAYAEQYGYEFVSLGEPKTISMIQGKPIEILAEEPTVTTILTDLNPNTVYNYYILYSDADDKLLTPANIQYITQFVSGSDGTAEIDTGDTFLTEDAVMLAVPAETTAYEPTEPDPTEPDTTETEPSESDTTEPDPTETAPTETDPTEPDITETEPTETQPTEPNPTETAPTEPAPTEPESTEPTPADILLGDVNLDSTINAGDAAMTLSAAAAYGATGSYGNLTATQIAAADIDENGSVNASDAAYILQYAAIKGANGKEFDIRELVKQHDLIKSGEL